MYSPLFTLSKLILSNNIGLINIIRHITAITSYIIKILSLDKSTSLKYLIKFVLLLCL